MDRSADADDVFILSRSFDAPREAVWQAFTDPAQLRQWWGLPGSELRVLHFELRPHGSFVYAMAAAGYTMWGRFVYREIEAPGRIVFTNAFSNAQGGLIRAPFNPEWPLEVLNTWIFDEVPGAAGKSTLTMRGQPIDATEAEQATFRAGFDSMRMGFGGTFDLLRDHLRRRG